MPITTTQNDILIFRTNIRNKKDLLTITPVLNADTRILQWNVAQDDTDRVLRVKSNSSLLYPQDIIFLLREAGFFCEELPD